MEPLVYQLREIIKINTQVLTALQTEQVSIDKLRESYDKRKTHIDKMDEIIPTINEEALTEQEKVTLQKLFDKFVQQSNKIQRLLDSVTKESQDKLTDAVQRRKAEDGYRVLK